MYSFYTISSFEGCTRQFIILVFQSIVFQPIFFLSIRVRSHDRISMNTIISSNPRDAVAMVWARLGMSEKRP